MASEVPAEADLDEDEVTPLSVEGAWVRARCVRDSSGVDQVRCRSMARLIKGVLGNLREDPVRDAVGGGDTFLTSLR